MTVRLERLYEREGLPAFAIPEELARGYGGNLGFDRPRLYANFVASVDGVVALPGELESGGVISQQSEADRFVMGLLRACADTVLIGAGTFRKTPSHFWDAEHIYPAAAAAFAALRQKLGLPRWPRFVVVSASGELDLSQPALRRDAVIVTTESGQARLSGGPPAATIMTCKAPIDLRAVIEGLRAQGAGLILTEGGPTLIGQLIDQGLLDELFLTRSPVLFGRKRDDGRKALVEGVDLAKGGRTAIDLVSVRRHASYLFLRYALSRQGT